MRNGKMSDNPVIKVTEIKFMTGPKKDGSGDYKFATVQALGAQEPDQMDGSRIFTSVGQSVVTYEFEDPEVCRALLSRIKGKKVSFPHNCEVIYGSKNRAGNVVTTIKNLKPTKREVTSVDTFEDDNWDL